MQKNYEELDFTDDFMFCKVLTNNPELCHELLELVIGKNVGKFTRLDKQKPIEITADGKACISTLLEIAVRSSLN